MTQFAGEPTSGTTTEIGGLPAVGYDQFALPNDPDKRSSRVVFLFDGNVEYEINCQSNPEGQDKGQGLRPGPVDAAQEVTGTWQHTPTEPWQQGGAPQARHWRPCRAHTSSPFSPLSASS